MKERAWDKKGNIKEKGGGGGGGITKLYILYCLKNS